MNVTRETRTTPKTSRLPTATWSQAAGINQLLKDMTWKQAIDFAKDMASAGWDATKAGAQTYADAWTTQPDPYDAMRGLGTGLRKAGESAAGFPGDIGDWAEIMRNVLAQRMGFSEQDTRRTDFLNPLGYLPNNKQVTDASRRMFGDYYQPTSPLGRTYDFLGSNVDPEAVLPGGSVFKAAKAAGRLF